MEPFCIKKGEHFSLACSSGVTYYMNKLDKLGTIIFSILCHTFALEMEHHYHLFFKCEVASKTCDVVINWLEFWAIHYNLARAMFNSIYDLHYTTKKKFAIEIVVYSRIW